MMRFRMSLLAILAVLAGASDAMAADLTIKVKNVRDAKGFVLIALYDHPETFLKLPQARARQKAKSGKGEISFVFHDLPAGTYAASSFQDEDDSGTLKTNFLGIPTEGYGFSNDVQGRGGPPRFAQAAFDFDANSDKTIAFSLKY